MRFPEILEWDDERLAHSYILLDEALAYVFLPSAEELRRSPAFHFQQGTEHYRQGHLREAIAAYRQCVTLDATFPKARYNLGVALGDVEEYAEAIACLRAVVEAEPELAETWNSLGYLACRERRPREAVSYYERAIELRDWRSIPTSWPMPKAWARRRAVRRRSI